jgi:hypothetical protein
MNFTLDLIILFEKLDKNIEIGNNEWHGAPFGEISEFQNHYDENIWSCQRRK